MENSDNLYDIYINNLKEGKYTIPLFWDIYKTTVRKYGEDKVDLLITPKKEKFEYVWDNLEDIKTFDILCKYFLCNNTEVNSQTLDNSDFIINNHGIMYMKIIIYFPKVEISNSEGRKHKIYDIYVKFTFDDNCALKRKPGFMRSTYTPEEFNINYAHSHISTSYVSSLKNRGILWGEACFGGGTTINSLLTQWQCNSHKLYIEQWMQVLITIDIFLEWESLEGGPYVKMEYIQRDRSLNYPRDLSNYIRIYEDTIKCILEKILNEYISIKICSDKKGFLYIDLVKDRDGLEDRFLKEWLKIHNFIPEAFICRKYKDRLSTRYYNTIRDTSTNVLDLELFQFKNKPVKLKFIKNQEENMDKYCIIPMILNGFLENLKNKLNDRRKVF